MVSQFLIFGRCDRLPSQQWIVRLVSATLGAIAVGFPLAGSPGIAREANLPRPYQSKAALLQAFPHNQSSHLLGTPVTTNYRTYCGQEGAPLDAVITDRPLCDYTSIGGGDVSDVPIANPDSQPTWTEMPMMKPIVLQQYDKAQLFPFNAQ